MISDFKDIQLSSWILSVIWETVKWELEVSSMNEKFTKKFEILKEGKSSNKKEKKEWQKKRKGMGNTISTLGQKNNKRSGS